MKPAATVVVLALWGAAFAPAQDLPAWVLDLAHIKNQAKRQLERLPNFACLETIHRYERAPGSQVVKPVDTIRLEVAFVGGREMFSQVGGSGGFQDMELSAIGRGGILGTGSFSAVARNLFVNDLFRTTASGKERVLERPALRYDFVIPENRAGYRLQTTKGEASVGIEGTFWADEETLQVLRVEEHATDIAPFLEVRDATTVVTYEKVRIGTSDVLMPKWAETVITTELGEWRRNATEFTACREYTAESVIRFDSQEPAAKKK